MALPPPAWLRERVLDLAPAALGAGLLGWFCVRAVRVATGGEPAMPLDDSYIHFQFARAFAEGRPLEFAAGAPPVAGATSLLWPALLAPFWKLGWRGAELVWVAWVLGFAALGGLAFETQRLARRLVTPPAALGAAAMALCFGGNVWCAASGMEVIPFAWLLVRSARRAAEWVEAHTGPAALAAPDAPEPPESAAAPMASSEAAEPLVPSTPPAPAPRLAELVALGWLTPLMRPEGALGSLLIAAALLVVAVRQEGARALLRRPRALGLAGLTLLGAGVPSLVNLALTGSARNTTLEVKWLFASPYLADGRAWKQVGENLQTLFVTLFDGQIWSSVFLPQGSAPVFWLALPALIAAGARTGRTFRAAAVLAVALGMLLPATYDSFLWNRLRYLWPFSAGWFIGVAALSDWLAEEARRVRPAWAVVGPLASAAAAGALLAFVPYSVKDVATSANAIRSQQVALGRWAADALPATALVGVSDTGAIAYFSGRRTFDVVGLTTRGEARYWAAGAGSRFEHYERLPAERRPTHFIVYRHWMALDPLLGEVLEERTVRGATILGGETMEACAADWAALGSGALPATPPAGAVRDALDVADLESEAEHGYGPITGTSLENVVIVSEDGRVDGARTQRTVERFSLELGGARTLVARLTSSGAARLTVSAGARTLGTLELDGSGWQELALALPPDLPAGRAALTITADRDARYGSAHYWAY